MSHKNVGILKDCFNFIASHIDNLGCIKVLLIFHMEGTSVVANVASAQSTSAMASIAVAVTNA